ncbi:pyridine nucleotide-disulfide oxidoreductase [Acuticoccus sediminis]|uniref:Pyridine nucleotide-disulfide oxidoreductase n=1 Tax=Acuticoccus sediminis TaxID=2184697 RepID=A0A8B2NPL4_9HYPH|nr:FAD-dependent oxidoreductase [Acuticoccus sediminis]RAI00209.1 pyridine nucleotide-disulfide oxidoreductase [Acuticoccus sediminis]
MESGRIVIVGAGQGGFQAAASLRQEGFRGEIVLIGDETGLPYQRPPLSKAYLKTGVADELELRPAAFFEAHDITLVNATRVEAIDREGKAVVAGDRRFPYDHLIIATGTRNLRPPIPGLERTVDLRTLADAARLRDHLAGPRRIAVIGGGFIGLEFAAVARALGHTVTVAEAATRLMARVVSPEVSARFLDMHRGMGTEVLLGQPVAEVTETGIALADGTVIAADMVLLAAGVRPNAELAAAAGLTVANGVVVDTQLATADPDISALGDCAVFPDPRTGRPVRLESVQAAVDHARTIAKRLVKGSTDAYAAVPWFWSDQADWKLQIAGLSSPEDDSVLRGDGAVLRFDGDVLTAVETINDGRTHMQARRLMAGDAPLTRDALAPLDYDLGPLMKASRGR